MRIIKPNKSPGSNISLDSLSERNTKSGDLLYEEVAFNGAGQRIKQGLSNKQAQSKVFNAGSEGSAKISTSKIAPSKIDSSAKEGVEGRGGLKKEFNAMLAKGIRLLAMREHSVQEMHTKLSSKTDSNDVVFEVVEELKNAKYLSDDRFTEVFIRSKLNKGYGPSRIRADLKSKGIDNSMIDEYLDPASAVWIESAQNLYLKKYGDKPVTDYNTWAKRARFMQSRGFSMEQIQITVPSVKHD